MQGLQAQYKEKKKSIKQHLGTFQGKSEPEKLQEFLFCILTPQSKAERCWVAVQSIPSVSSHEDIVNLLKGQVRFHNTKADRLTTAILLWPRVKMFLGTRDRIALRNWVAETVPGYGLKEAGHFLRNIGYSENQIAILDRHILRNLVSSNVLKTDVLKGEKDYKAVEQKMLEFSKKVSIPVDDLDLLFWHKEHGVYFK